MPERTDRFLRLNDVVAKVGIGKTKLYEMINAGEFPRATKVNGNVVRWSENAVDDWIAARVVGDAPPPHS